MTGPTQHGSVSQWPPPSLDDSQAGLEDFTNETFGRALR
jgi:hypothetical protein